MLIRELAKQTGVAATTIRYYESIGLIPAPERGENNYRQYSQADAERLRFIASARSLGFSLDDITEFLAARADGSLPCQRVLASLDQQISDVERRIADLLALRETLISIRQAAQALPQDQGSGEQCVCYLLTIDRQTGRVFIQPEEKDVISNSESN
jgi:DNA-binding transcriptional MerR regulator